MTYNCENRSMKGGVENQKNRADHMCLAASDDGIHWNKMNGGNPFAGPYTDTLACLHHDKEGNEYVLTKRYEHPVGKGDQARGVRGAHVMAGPMRIDVDKKDAPIRWRPEVSERWALDRE